MVTLKFHTDFSLFFKLLLISHRDKKETIVELNESPSLSRFYSLLSTLRITQYTYDSNNVRVNLVCNIIHKLMKLDDRNYNEWQ